MAPASNTQAEITSLPVTVQRYFELALYLLVLTGFGTLVSTGGLDAPTVLLVGAAILFRGYLLATRRVLLIPENWITTLTLSYVAFYLADYFVFSGVFVTATVHLVLFVMVVRLFSTNRDRDYYFLAVISFLMVLAAAVLTVDSTFLLAFAVFMLMAVVTCILMEMRRAASKATIRVNSSSADLAYRQMGFSLAGTSPALVFLILLGASGIFFVLPRMSNGYLSAFARSREISSGFSDRVQLGQIGEIQQSNTLVMHIQINGDPHGSYDLKWRGVTLNLFDGKTWFNPHAQHVVSSPGSGRFPVSHPPSGAAQLIHYHVLMEPLVSNVFFLAPTAIVLQGNYRMVSVDDGDAVFDIDPEHPINRYEATSNVAQPSIAELRNSPDDYPPEVLLNYLQLPRLDPRVVPLARQITASKGNNFDKAAAIESYLRTNFGYTLQLPSSVPRDPVANFLFERKRGHCEYFASSMAIMLRTLGIPSRVVNGFRTGEFNDLTSQYLVPDYWRHGYGQRTSRAAGPLPRSKTFQTRAGFLDCTTIVPELSGSEFFGHERGAFTGALAHRDGAFALANGGTLFLDEVGLAAQSAGAVAARGSRGLLQACWRKYLARNEVSFWGVATNKGFGEELAQGRFRHDFYFRIASWTCKLPSLRERPEDIVPLARHFMQDRRTRDREPPEMDEFVCEYLLSRQITG